MTAYLRPRHLEEALAMRAAHPEYMVLAGATDLMVNAPRLAEPPGIIDLWRLPAFQEIERVGDQLVISAGACWAKIRHDARINEQIPILAEAASEIGALQIQNRATIGGNIATSSPVGDSLPVLLALDAVLELGSVRGRRTLPYREFCTGYRKTALAADELIVSVRIPIPPPGHRQLWRKVGTRRAQSISKVMAAAVLGVEGGVITRARIGLGAVADRPIRPLATEAAILGKPPAEAAEAARHALGAELHPISDVRSTADYRLDTAVNLVARFILSLP